MSALVDTLAVSTATLKAAIKDILTQLFPKKGVDPIPKSAYNLVIGAHDAARINGDTTMTTSFETIKLEWNDNDNTFRAIIMTNDPDSVAQFAGAQNAVGFVVTDIFEADSIDVVRDVIKRQYPDVRRYRVDYCNAAGDPVDCRSDGHAFGDALEVLKRRMYELAQSENVSNVARNASVMKSAEAILAARKAAAEREIAADLAERAEAARKAERAECAAERADFAAWATTVRARRDFDSAEHKLMRAMTSAYAVVEKFDEKRNEFVAKLTAHATNALSWSGSFVELSAEFDVSRELVKAFENGASAESIRTFATKQTIWGAKNSGASRSTSVMSNLVEDATTKAWADVMSRFDGGL